MTAQEQQMLEDLTTRINQTQLAEKDPEAEQFLAQKLGRNPDALYIMAQTTLVQGYALEQAQKQLADARTQIEQLQQAPPKHSGSFLGNLLGMNDEPAPPQQYAPVQSNPRPGSYYAQQPPPYAQPQYAPPPPSGGVFQQGGFLRSAMTTATGVAAGALAFEGIESLMHGFGGHSGGQGFFGGGNDTPREEIVNNYYGDSAPEQHEHHNFANSDVENRSNDFADTSSYDSGSDSGSGDDYNPDGNDTSF